MKTKLLSASLLALGLVSSIAVSAADTASLSVSATVLGRCKFTGAASAMTLTNAAGGIDPSVATSATGSSTITYKCTKGYTPTFATGAGSNDNAGNKRVSDGTNFMIYTLGYTGGGAGDGFGGADRTLTIDGTIVSTEFVNAPAGTYTDTVTVAINN